MPLLKMAGVYIHIPFCRSRCIYCDFCSSTLSAKWQRPYVEALGKEMDMREKELTEQPVTGRPAETTSAGQERIATLYIGGGTPSLLGSEVLHELFDAVERYFCLSADAEITIEANPDDVTPEWVAALHDTPVNRISMGVQSLDDEILCTLRRRHTAAQARRAVELLQTADYTNLSLDLIYGLPGQSLKQFTSDVREVLNLDVPHLSAYALQFEEGTPLYHMLKEGKVCEADEELSLSCYERLMDLTQEAGLEHYEISNFARPGFRSRHNSSYWTGTAYIGLGAGAHSYDGRCTRSANIGDVIQYIEAIRKGERPTETEILSKKERYNERVMLSLRTKEGLSLPNLEHDFGTDMRRYCERMAEPHLARERIQKKAGETLCLTRQGLFVSDDIISDLLV